MSCTTLNGNVKTESHPKNNVYFFDTEGNRFIVHTGQLAIHVPQDAQRPGVSINGPASIKKVGVKAAM